MKSIVFFIKAFNKKAVCMFLFLVALVEICKLKSFSVDC